MMALVYCAVLFIGAVLVGLVYGFFRHFFFPWLFRFLFGIATEYDVDKGEQDD